LDNIIDFKSSEDSSEVRVEEDTFSKSDLQHSDKNSEDEDIKNI
jgi:hypothetical protein